MPDRPLKFCEEPGCRTRVELGYCKAHTPKKKRPPHLHGSRYERKRAAFLKANPYCALKLKGCETWAVILDHIIPQSERPDLAMDDRNWQGLCKWCNYVKTMEDNRRWYG